MSKKDKKKANIAVSLFKWLRRRDLNPRSLAYEASENDQTSLLRYKTSNWSEWQDSNLRHLAPKASGMNRANLHSVKSFRAGE